MDQPITIEYFKKEAYQRTVRTSIFSMLSVIACAIFCWDTVNNLGRGAFIAALFVQLQMHLGIVYMRKMRWILDGNGISQKSPLGIKTRGWDSVLEYGIEPSRNRKIGEAWICIVFTNPKKRITLSYTEEIFSLLKRRCGAPAYDKREKPSP